MDRQVERELRRSLRTLYRSHRGNIRGGWNALADLDWRRIQQIEARLNNES